MDSLGMFWMGLALGVAGSAHCIGMCGPLALALPTGDAGPLRRAGYLAAYSAGRVATYATLGAGFGVLGLGIRLAGMQQLLSIAVGISLILAVVLPQLLVRFKRSKPWPWEGAVHKALRRWMGRPSTPRFVGVGLVNGLLPCGLVYTALAGASVSGSVASGMTFMAGFGFGTVPALFAVAWLAKGASSNFRTGLRRVLPVLTLIVGLLFVLRGLGLGIPMISPPTGALQVGSAVEMCH